MQDQPEEPLDKRFPSVRLAAQASLQQLSIYLKKRHVWIPSLVKVVRMTAYRQAAGVINRTPNLP
jgi:hypothetical protein